MWKTKQNLNLKNLCTFFIHFDVRQANLYVHGQKNVCVAAKILENLHFLLFFVLFCFPFNFDKEKWYCMYIEQLLKNNGFFIFATILKGKFSITFIPEWLNTLRFSILRESALRF